MNTHSHPKKIYMDKLLCAKCSATSDRQFISPLTNVTAHTPMCPTISGTPIKEFTTEGCFSMAFPTLFHTGAADDNAATKSSLPLQLQCYPYTFHNLCALSYSSLPLPLQSYPYTLHCASSALAQTRPTMLLYA